jgi:hypothetical protein
MKIIDDNETYKVRGEHILLWWVKILSSILDWTKIKFASQILYLTLPEQNKIEIRYVFSEMKQMDGRTDKLQYTTSPFCVRCTHVM